MGYLRMRKSINLGPGVRLNLGKKSASLSFGGRGYRYTVSTTGRNTRTIGIPGSGVSFVSSEGGRGKTSAAQVRSASAPSPSLPKPGLFSPAYEKKYFEGLQYHLKGDYTSALAAFEAASSADRRNISDEFFAGFAANALGDKAKAIAYLERVAQSDIELPDALMRKYLAGARVSVAIAITSEISAEVEFDGLGAALMLAELYQECGRTEEAIGLLQQLADEDTQSMALKLSLCDLLYEDGDDEEIVNVCVGVENESDEALGCLFLRARSLERQGIRTAALDLLTDCLRKSKRNPDLLKAIRYERAQLYGASGKNAQARKDWERLYASDPGYRDVVDRVKSEPFSAPPALYTDLDDSSG